MNPVLILTHNNLELTKRCVESVLAQDIETQIYVFDNGSTDGTVEWGRLSAVNGTFENSSTLREFWEAGENKGVSCGWNTILDYLFEKQHIEIEHMLVIGNDTVLPPWFYRELLQYLGESHWRPFGDSSPVEFVAGLAVDSIEQIALPGERGILTPNPDFSAFLITRGAWEKIGPFDESLISWAGDCDYHIRAHRLGIPLYKASLPFFHQRSSTITLAPPKERRMLELQADADRETFRVKYGCLPGTPEYANLFK